MKHIAPITRNAYQHVTPEVWEAILWYVSQGVTLLAICEHPEVFPPPNGKDKWPDRATIVRYMGKNADKRAEYDEAGRIGAGMIDEETQAIADECDGTSMAAIRKAELRIKTRQHRASHLDRRRFGAKSEIKAEVEVTVPTSIEFVIHDPKEETDGPAADQSLAG